MKVSGFSASGWTSMNITKLENPGSGFLWSVGGDAVPICETVEVLLDAHSSPDPPGSWSCRCPCLPTDHSVSALCLLEEVSLPSGLECNVAEFSRLLTYNVVFVVERRCDVLEHLISIT